MTAGTCNRSMRTGQRELRGAVIEGSRFPCGDGVTRQTILRELSGHMIRRGHRSVIGLMARIAGRRKSFELTIGMTRGAIHRDVCPRQREEGLLMIEGRGFPHGRCMAIETLV